MFTKNAPSEKQAKIIDYLDGDWTDDEICEALHCTLAEISVVRGRFMVSYVLENGKKKRKTVEAANYHVTSVLSKEDSDRFLKPSVTEFDFVDAKGRKRTLSIKQ